MERHIKFYNLFFVYINATFTYKCVQLNIISVFDRYFLLTLLVVWLFVFIYARILLVVLQSFREQSLRHHTYLGITNLG